ncbi:bifunctional precorrin-2 dehydrogenase/sirohydrochlorin ferrochelatase [Paenibacillus sp. MWE-103]|uniref:precorrin-2 dehydrogenase n=1 Tax=Paenibacillus artemisiicola TaxID=1172618 RepID=A0ABS3WB05_9BACL|nr:bifunctional precorrin-2 dehydrogenase/sirohydrochlorin ferrochelatase [Paenibacillus artemisiicola]MBO7745467.1 bifunctional precorrin-2 dehydrogenase/sirohydrochlorin ferrochelatase [Paenibacillus artemisiicola]
MAAYYPMMMDLTGRRCVVVGGGPVAERKTLGLLDGGAGELIVVAPRVTAKLEELAVSGSIALERREYMESDADGAFLLFAATDDRLLNGRVAADAARLGALVNTADAGGEGDFATPAAVRRGELVIAVTTGGASPVLAALLRRRLAGQYGPAFEASVGRLHELRLLAQTGIADAGLRSAVLRLAAEQTMREAESLPADGEANAGETIEQWMSRLRDAAERGR